MKASATLVAPGETAAVAVILPALNEARHIGGLLDYLLAQAWIPDSIIVADGGSTDGTREIVAGMALNEARISLLHNPQRLQSAGVNLAVARLPPSVTAFVRLDVHAHYPAGFVAQAITSLQASQAASVVVRLHTVAETCFQRAVAEACNGALGTGGAAHRVAQASAFVDHGHHAAFLRAPFEEVGGYDETFSTNEDAEFDARLAKAGHRIWMDSDLVVHYLPRRSLRALARQYYRYGAGRARNVAKNRLRPRLRQLAPAGLTALVASSLLAAVVWPQALLVPATYLAAMAVAAALLAWKRRSACMAALLTVLPAIHLSWGTGFILSSLALRMTARRAESGA